MKELIKHIIPKIFHSYLYKTFNKKYNKSYSQSGEDMILNTIFKGKKKGFYIDVGANNPKMNSNTHFFYKLGWCGINIDALPGSMNKFNLIRPRDINLEIPISDKEETLKYYMFSSSSFNTFSDEMANSCNQKLIKTKLIQTKKLSDVLRKHVNNKEIDFMSIDVEGFDFQVLNSNNWNKFRPKILIVEFFINDIGTDKNKKIESFLNNVGYSMICSTPTNTIFIEKEFYKVRFLT